MSRYLHKRHFTLPEARLKLRELKPKLEEMIVLRAHLMELNYDIYKHEYFGGRGPNGSKFHPIELEKFVAIVRDLENEGILVKSFEEGLMDFPCVRSNGEEAYLCWKIGEADIEYWHGVEEGFRGRKHISFL